MSLLDAIWEWVRTYWGLQPDPNIKSWIEFATVAIGLVTAAIGLVSALVVLITKLFALWRQRQRHREMEERRREASRQFTDRQAAQALDEERRKKALDRFETLVTSLEERNDHTSDRALKLIGEGKWDQARGVLQEILLETSTNEKEGAKAARNLALLTDDKREAAKLYERAANLDRENTQDWIDAGDLYFESGDLEKAYDAYTQGFDRVERTQIPQTINDVREKLGTTLYKIGQRLETQGKLDRALEMYEASRDQRSALRNYEPANREWQRNLADAYEKIGRLRFALSNLGDTLRAHREFAIASQLASMRTGNRDFVRDFIISRGRLAKARRMHGDQTETRQALERAIKERPEDVAEEEQLQRSKLQEMLGDVFVVQEEWSSAKGWYEKAYAIRKELPTVSKLEIAVLCEKLGDVLSRHVQPAAGRFDQALTILQSLVETPPSDLDLAMVHERLGDEQGLAGDFNEAARHYKKAGQLVAERSETTARNRYLSDLHEKLADAALEHHDGRLPEALQEYEASWNLRKRLAGESEEDRLRLAKTHERLGAGYEKKARASAGSEREESEERAKTEWREALDIYSFLSEAARENLAESVFLQVFLFGPLWALGLVEERESGKIKLKRAVAFLRAHEEQFQPFTQNWIEQIDSAVEGRKP